MVDLRTYNSLQVTKHCRGTYTQHILVTPGPYSNHVGDRHMLDSVRRLHFGDNRENDLWLWLLWCGTRVSKLVLNTNWCFLAAVVLSEKWGNAFRSVFSTGTVEYCVRGVYHASGYYARSIPCQRNTISEGHWIWGVYHVSGVLHSSVPCQRGFVSMV